MYLLVYFSLIALASCCNPLKSSDCPSDPALASTFGGTFTSQSQYFSAPQRAGTITYGSDGVSLTMNKKGDNPTLVSNFYIFFGKVEVVLKAAQGQGIVSSFYLQSDTQDEVDIELFGGDPYEFQSNYFAKGDTSDFNRGGYHPTSSDPRTNFHTYTINWTPDFITWSLDGVVVRKLDSNSPQGFPQTPMRIYTGVWAGGDPDNAPGTINWAGGLTDYSKAPFTMQIKSMIVADYSSGTSYTYTGNSGTWESVKADGGQVMGRYEQAQEEFSDGGDEQTTFEPNSSLEKNTGTNTLLATAGLTGSSAYNAGKILITSDGSTFTTSIPRDSVTFAGEPTTTATLKDCTECCVYTGRFTFIITADGKTSTVVSTSTSTYRTNTATSKIITKTTSSSTSSQTSTYSMTPIAGGQPITTGGAAMATSNGGVGAKTITTNTNPTFANHPLTAESSQFSSFAGYTPTFASRSTNSNNEGASTRAGILCGILSFLVIII